MARKKAATRKPSDLSFEQAMSQLEEIVSAMEEEELPLEELVEKYETGTKLLGRCEEVLKSAKKKIQVVAAERAAAPPGEGDNEETDEADAREEESHDDDDIRLF